MRTLMFLAVMSSIAHAELSPRIEGPRQHRQALALVPVPCLRDARDRRVVVTWWIENKATGERRSVGSREVRQRC
ncbi:MAG: hypothetical protein H2043_06345 [Rhizobiales bacterium]|nr:hypothetical protein [Hyphomicrobiales bacterium]